MITFPPSPVASRWRGFGVQLLMLSFFIGGTLWIMPISLFVYDNDEGINVIKAVLMADGYPLYTQTWSDQPPIFTQLLQWTFALFGETMVVARLLVLVMTALFIWAYTATIRLQLGTVAAWVALSLLMLSDNFLRLSVSVMIGLPALSFAMMGVYLLQRFKRQEIGAAQPQAEPTTAHSGWWRLILAGLCMALSMQTKAFTVVLLPILALDLVDFGRDFGGNRHLFRRKLGDVLRWGTATVVIYLSIGLYYRAFDLEMLFGSHLSDTVQSAYQAESSWGELRSFLRYDYGHLLLAVCGLFVILTRRLRHGLLPLGWLLLALLLLLNHRPIWYHHYQLLSIPLCWLATYALHALFTPPTEKSTTAWAWGQIAGGTLTAVLLCGLIYLRSEQSIPYYNQRDYDQEIVDLLAADRAATEWVFADRATYPFYAGLRVPPEIAVFSRKRFFGENLDNQILLTVMQRYHPEQVLLTRFKEELLTDAGFAGYLDAHYTKIQDHPDYVYYRLRE